MNASLLWLLLACLIAPFAWGFTSALLNAPAAIAGGASVMDSLFFLPMALLGSALFASLLLPRPFVRRLAPGAFG